MLPRFPAMVDSAAPISCTCSVGFVASCSMPGKLVAGESKGASRSEGETPSRLAVSSNKDTRYTCREVAGAYKMNRGLVSDWSHLVILTQSYSTRYGMLQRRPAISLAFSSW